MTEGEALQKLGAEADLAAAQGLGFPKRANADGMIVVQLSENESIGVMAAIAAWNNAIQEAVEKLQERRGEDMEKFIGPIIRLHGANADFHRPVVFNPPDKVSFWETTNPQIPSVPEKPAGMTQLVREQTQASLLRDNWLNPYSITLITIVVAAFLLYRFC